MGRPTAISVRKPSLKIHRKPSPSPDVQTIIHDTSVKRPTTDSDMTYLEKKNIDEVTRQKLRKKDVYENYMHKIYNILVYQTKDQLHDNLASKATFQVVKTGRYPIGYLIILNNIFFSNQYEQHPIRYLCLATR